MPNQLKSESFIVDAVEASYYVVPQSPGMTVQEVLNTGKSLGLFEYELRTSIERALGRQEDLTLANGKLILARPRGVYTRIAHDWEGCPRSVATYEQLAKIIDLHRRKTGTRLDRAALMRAAIAAGHTQHQIELELAMMILLELLKEQDSDHLLITQQGVNHFDQSSGYPLVRDARKYPRPTFQKVIEAVQQCLSQKRSELIVNHFPRRVFVSHAKADESLVGLIVGYLMTAATVHEKKEILCTSLPGHELAPGENVSDAILDAIGEVGLVIGILTPQSLERQAVMMELGAAWALRKPFIPLLWQIGFDRIPDWISRHAVRLDASIASFDVFNSRIVPVMEGVERHAGLRMKGATAIASATHGLFSALSTLPSQPDTAGVVALSTTSEKSRDPRVKLRKKIDVWLAATRAGQQVRKPMPLAWPSQVKDYLDLMHEAQQIDPSIEATLFSDEPGGRFAPLGVTETSIESLVAAGEMLKIALDD